MTHLSTTDVKGWWIGTLPSWMMVGAVAIIGFFVKEKLSDDREFRKQIEARMIESGNRTARLEQQAEATADVIEKLYRQLDDLNKWLRTAKP